MNLKDFFAKRLSFGEPPTEKAVPRERPVRNANVAALNKRVNESDRYSVGSVHKAFDDAMSQVKAKARG